MEIADHLAMVFHRFLSREARRRLPLNILINDRPLRAWDPFARNETETRALAEQKLALTDGSASHRVAVRPYVLPSESRFSTPRAHHAAGGPRRWNRQQGFYFYRNDRMIQAGGWNRIRTSDEHTKLARISVDFSPAADHLFELNVSKTQVRVPAELRAELATIASSVARFAQDSYRGKSDGHQGADITDARIQAVRQLVGLVISAVRVALTEEFGPRSVELQSISERISRLEQRLVMDMAQIAESRGVRNGDGAVAESGRHN
jgi:hypothetical protein